MAGQRRSEPDSRRGLGPGGLGSLGLALSLCLILLPACGEGGATGIDRPNGNDGVSGGEGAAERLIGTWRTVALVEVPGDIQAWATTWRFDPDGRCVQLVETRSVAEGFPRITERPCTFVAGDFEVSVAFTGGGTLVFVYSFADFSPDRLILDGFEYERLA
jgi:hypothetical protein